MTKLLLIFCISCSLTAHAQQIQKQIINTAGTTYTNAGIRLKTSIGEPIVGKVSNSNASGLSQGFFTGLKTITTTAPATTVKQFRIFPNPVRNTCTLSGDLSSVSQLKLYDMAGHIVLVQNSSFAQIPMNRLSAGFYIAKLIGKSGEVINTFKIVKY